MFQGISLTYEACWSRRRVTRDFHDYNATQCTTSQAFFVLQKRRENVGNARACGSQRPAAGVTQAIRAVLIFFRNADDVPAELRCGALRDDGNHA